MSKLSFRARALDAAKPMPVFLAEELPDLPDYSAINRAVPLMPSGMEKEEECEHHLQRAICTGLIIPTPEVCSVHDPEFYEKCYPSDYRMPKQHIHMQPLWQEQEAPEYDMDTDDERWLRQQRHPELTVLKFEQMMDKLERSSGQTVVTLNEAKLLLDRHDDLVIAVYDYWLNKRLKMEADSLRHRKQNEHPLVLTVRTEGRVGQSTNNPYLAFRRRTEKMQTRKNRKNDESSYEKMLKLRRDLARAVTLLEMVARRERVKRDSVKLNALLAERRYQAGDFSGQMLAELTQAQPVRTAYAPVSLPPVNATYRRDIYAHYPPRAPPTPVEQTRQKEKRPCKRRKHRHHTPGAVQPRAETAVYSSSSEEGTNADGATTPDDGPFAFRRKPGCFYQMPTSTLYGDPIDPDSATKDSLYEHEIDQRLRYTLTSVNEPYQRCVGFARRRVGRGGRVILERVTTPLDDLWPRLPFEYPRSSEHLARSHLEADVALRRHRDPVEIATDYHAGGKYPWRHAFRRHLSRNPSLWCEAPSPTPGPGDADSQVLPPQIVKSDISLSEARTLSGPARKRSYSTSSDEGALSSDSLEPVEKEFDAFYDEVNRKWLHFRPKTPPPVHPSADDDLALSSHTSFTVRVESSSREPLLSDAAPSDAPFLTAPLTLQHLQTEGLDHDLPDPFLSHGRSAADGRAPSGPTNDFGSSVVRVSAGPSESIPLDPPPPPKREVVRPKPKPKPEPRPKTVLEEVKAVKRSETLEEVQITHNVQLKTVQTKHSPLKKHIITATPHMRPEAVIVSAGEASTPQLVTVAVSESLKVKLQNHLLTTSQGSTATVVGLVQNGPFSTSAPMAVAVSREAVCGRRVPPVVVAAGSLQHKTLPPVMMAQPVVVPPTKLKVLHAGALTHSQRTQLLAQSRATGLAQLPTVVSLATLGDGKATTTAALQLKTAPGSVAQFFEIKGGQLAKGPHLVNVVRQPQPGKPVARLDLNDAKKRGQVVATFDGAALKGNLTTATRPHRVSLSLDARHIVRAALPSVRAPQVRHQIQLKNRTLQVARSAAEPSTSITIAAPAKTASVVANLLQKNVQMPKGGQKIAISGAAGQTLAANVQAIAFSTAQLKARQARLIAQPRPTPVAEIVEASTAPAVASSSSGVISADGQLQVTDGEASTNGTVRRRPADSLPMEVT